MADKRASVVIIKKKKGGGHAAHHGGAWKVAYADFVTAMMCFFLVMWLMGSDEETKADITHYFNHPSTPWKMGGDPQSNMARPLGERKGSGEQMLQGLNGANPDDLVQNPVRPVSDAMQANRELNDRPHPRLDDQLQAVEMDIDSMRFSILDSHLFKPGTFEFAPGSEKYLTRLSQIVKGYTGTVQIVGFSSSYELSTAKAVAVMKHMVEERWLIEDRIKPKGLLIERSPAGAPVVDEEADEALRRNRVEFILSKKTGSR